MASELERQARIWLKARNIIANALKELSTRQTDYDVAADAIIARLAKHRLLIWTADELAAG